jgi:hypothetical protein
MAHRPVVGTGISFTAVAAGTATTSFAIKSPYLRITPRSTGVHVSVSQTAVTPSVGDGDYYIPSGTSETLSMSRYSQRIIAITQADGCVLTCPEGQQMPFNVGNYVTLIGANDVNYDNKITHALVTAVDNNSSQYDGTWQTKLTLDADTSGITTAFTFTEANGDVTLYSSARCAAKSDGAYTDFNIIQVQTTGEA